MFATAIYSVLANEVGQKSKPFPRVQLKFVKPARGRPPEASSAPLFHTYSFLPSFRSRFSFFFFLTSSTRLRASTFPLRARHKLYAYYAAAGQQHHETVTRETGPASNAHGRLWVQPGTVSTPDLPRGRFVDFHADKIHATASHRFLHHPCSSREYAPNPRKKKKKKKEKRPRSRTKQNQLVWLFEVRRELHVACLELSAKRWISLRGSSFSRDRGYYGVSRAIQSGREVGKFS